MNTRHPGNMQIRLPKFIAHCPAEWATNLNWCTGAWDGKAFAYLPAVGAVTASMYAELNAMPREKRLAFLRRGLRRLQAKEDELNVPARQRMRLFISDAIRPAGDVVRPSAP